MQADVLNRRPDNGEATGLGGKHVDLIGALSHIAEEAFDGIGGLNMPMHAALSMDIDFIDTRRVFMANRGIWEAIATAGPAASFAHTDADIDYYLTVLNSFLDEIK